MSQANKKVAYLTTSFSSISHTFIRREVEALKMRGIEVGLFGVRPDKESMIWDAETSFLYPLNYKKIIKSFFNLARLKPGNLCKALAMAIFNEELNPYQHLKLIYHFFISLAHADSIIERKYDHIHAHFINVPTTIAMYCSMITGVPFSFTCHSAGELKLKEVIGVRQKVKRASFVRVISDYLINNLKELLRNKKSVYVIRCGIDFSNYQPRESFEFQNPVKLLAIGRLVEKKGFKYLIEALNILQQKANNFILTIIGSGPLLNELKELVDKYSLSRKVNFLLDKSYQEVESYLKTSDLLIVPSVTSSTGEKEGIPTVIIEGIRAGVPLIATKHSGIPEVIIDGETGYLVEEANSKTLASKIELFLSDPNNFASKVVKKAFLRTKELYDEEQICNNLIKVFFDNAN